MVLVRKPLMSDFDLRADGSSSCREPGIRPGRSRRRMAKALACRRLSELIRSTAREPDTP